MMSLCPPVSILVSWYKNSGTVLLVGAAGTASPAEGRIGKGFFETISVEGKVVGIADVKLGVEL